MHIRSRILILVLVLGAVSASFAGITGSSGDVAVISPPASVLLGELTSETDIHAFLENEDLILPGNVPVDVSSSGLFTSTSLSPAVLSAGTKVDTYLLHINSESTSLVSFSGSVTFDADVLGVILVTSALTNTDLALGNATTLYPAGNHNRGFEPPTTPLGDSVFVSVDLRTVTVDLNSTSQLDQLRVITAASPSVPVRPSTWGATKRRFYGP